MISYFDYYKKHPLKDIAESIFYIVNNEKTAIAIMAASKKSNDRLGFLKTIIDNYTEISPQTWIQISSYRLDSVKKAVLLNKEGILDDFILITEFNEELSNKITKSLLENRSYCIETIKRVAEDIRLKDNFSLIQTFIFFKINPKSNSLLDKSNNVYKTFKIKEQQMFFKNIIIKPMEYFEEFYKTGQALSSCTGGRKHWSSVLKGASLRFMVIRDKRIVGTILYDFNEMTVYGFEKNYQNYTKETIEEISSFINSFVNIDLTQFSYTKHGWGKNLISL